MSASSRRISPYWWFLIGWVWGTVWWNLIPYLPIWETTP